MWWEYFIAILRHYIYNIVCNCAIILRFVWGWGTEFIRSMSMDRSLELTLKKLDTVSYWKHLLILTIAKLTYSSLLNCPNDQIFWSSNSVVGMVWSVKRILWFFWRQETKLLEYSYIDTSFVIYWWFSACFWSLIIWSFFPL